MSPVDTTLLAELPPYILMTLLGGYTWNEKPNFTAFFILTNLPPLSVNHNVPPITIILIDPVNT